MTLESKVSGTPSAIRARVFATLSSRGKMVLDPCGPGPGPHSRAVSSSLRGEAHLESTRWGPNDGELCLARTNHLQFQPPYEMSKADEEERLVGFTEGKQAAEPVLFRHGARSTDTAVSSSTRTKLRCTSPVPVGEYNNILYRLVCRVAGMSVGADWRKATRRAAGQWRYTTGVCGLSSWSKRLIQLYTVTFSVIEQYVSQSLHIRAVSDWLPFVAKAYLLAREYQQIIGERHSNIFAGTCILVRLTLRFMALIVARLLQLYDVTGELKNKWAIVCTAFRDSPVKLWFILDQHKTLSDENTQQIAFLFRTTVEDGLEEDTEKPFANHALEVFKPIKLGSQPSVASVCQPSVRQLKATHNSPSFVGPENVHKILRAQRHATVEPGCVKTRLPRNDKTEPFDRNIWRECSEAFPGGCVTSKGSGEAGTLQTNVVSLHFVLRTHPIDRHECWKSPSDHRHETPGRVKRRGAQNRPPGLRRTDVLNKTPLRCQPYREGGWGGGSCSLYSPLIRKPERTIVPSPPFDRRPPLPARRHFLPALRHSAAATLVESGRRSVITRVTSLYAAANEDAGSSTDSTQDEMKDEVGKWLSERDATFYRQEMEIFYLRYTKATRWRRSVPLSTIASPPIVADDCCVQAAGRFAECGHLVQRRGDDTDEPVNYGGIDSAGSATRVPKVTVGTIRLLSDERCSVCDIPALRIDVNRPVELEGRIVGAILVGVLNSAVKRLDRTSARTKSSDKSRKLKRIKSGSASTARTGKPFIIKELFDVENEGSVQDEIGLRSKLDLCDGELSNNGGSTRQGATAGAIYRLDVPFCTSRTTCDCHLAPDTETTLTITNVPANKEGPEVKLHTEKLEKDNSTAWSNHFCSQEVLLQPLFMKFEANGQSRTARALIASAIVNELEEKRVSPEMTSRRKTCYCSHQSSEKCDWERTYLIFGVKISLGSATHVKRKQKKKWMRLYWITSKLWP
ncbi:hypothetical protein PR048_006294 [Dryococelus australis]|uniref:Uncharacterized protein n=1 Tax=Dryococelus australis TaxID=614101 RepID=A0ABQ9IBS7_9NEOP|nr:hypothetical protein PR048_006294 [Dryococelus australis]